MPTATGLVFTGFASVRDLTCTIADERVIIGTT